jgi:hypothetical protein
VTFVQEYFPDTLIELTTAGDSTNDAGLTLSQASELGCLSKISIIPSNASSDFKELLIARNYEKTKIEGLYSSINGNLIYFSPLPLAFGVFDGIMGLQGLQTTIAKTNKLQKNFGTYIEAR